VLPYILLVAMPCPHSGHTCAPFACNYSSNCAACGMSAPVPTLGSQVSTQTQCVVCRDALVQGPPGLKFVAYGSASTSVTTGYGVAAPVPLVPCTALDNTTVCLLVLHPAVVVTSGTS